MNPKPLKILITGASGRVGSAVAARLAAEHKIVGLDRVPGPYTQQVGDLTDPALLPRALVGVDAVVHTASLHAPHVGQVSDAEFRAVNVGGTKRLLDACLDRGIQRLVYTSTTSLYGAALVPTDRAVWVDESLTPIPRDIYDETKLAAEDLCRQASLAGLSCISLRMSRCFPEPERLMAIYRLHRGVDLRDVAHAHALAIAASTRGFEVLNISAPTPFTLADCTELLTDAARVMLRYFPWANEEFAQRRWTLPQAIDRVYVSARAYESLGFAPQFGFADWFGRPNQLLS
jgi:UDP-glucose 4-epimerase